MSRFPRAPSLQNARHLFATLSFAVALAAVPVAPVARAATTDLPPVVTAPATQSVVSENLLFFSIRASDPDGDAITDLVATGSAVLAGGTFARNANSTAGTFTWTPACRQAGSYSVTFVASNALTGDATTVITVTPAAIPPEVIAPLAVSTNEGAHLTFNVYGINSRCGGLVTLVTIQRPVGATFVDLGTGIGTFSWTPDYSQAGDWTVTFQGTNQAGITSFATTAIHVNNTNRAPIAEAGGPYQGFKGVPVMFDGSGSSDPDGDKLSYLWSFGDGFQSTDAMPSHTYDALGTYVVTLTVADPGGMQSTDTATASIVALCGATLYLAGDNKFLTLNPNTHNPHPWCPAFEPDSRCFAITDIVASTIVLKYPAGVGPGIPAEKLSTQADLNNNGIDEIAVCFSMDDLLALFAGLPPGNNSLEVSIEGSLMNGGHFAATGTIGVVAGGGHGAASLMPNPLHPTGNLHFVTDQPGALRVQLFDIQGRLVRTLLDEPGARAGSHAVAIDGRSAGGASLPAGIYFYRIEIPGGRTTGRVVIVR